MFENPLRNHTDKFTETRKVRGVRPHPLQAEITTRGGRVSGVKLFVGPQQISQSDLTADELDWLNDLLTQYGRPSAR